MDLNKNFNGINRVTVDEEAEVWLDGLHGKNFVVNIKTLDAGNDTIQSANGGSLTIDSRADLTYQLADDSQFSANHEQAIWQAK